MYPAALLDFLIQKVWSEGVDSFFVAAALTVVPVAR